MEAFVGKWTLDKNENFDAFLTAVGVNAIMRGIAAVVSGSQTITALPDGRYKMVVVNGPRTKEVMITIGAEFEDEANEVGMKAKGIWNIEDGKMIGTFETEKGNNLKVSREIVGDTLYQTMNFDGTVAKRTYKKK